MVKEQYQFFNLVHFVFEGTLRNIGASSSENDGALRCLNFQIHNEDCRGGRMKTKSRVFYPEGA